MLLSTFIWEHFIWDHSHLRPQSFETTVIWYHAHLRPRSFQTTVIWDHIHEVFSFETTFIWDHIYLKPYYLRPIQLRPHHLRPHHLRPHHLRPHHLRPHSFETTFIWDHSHLRPQSFEATLKWSFFDLLWITFLRSTFNFFAGNLKFCKVTLDSFEVLQGYALPCQEWLRLGCKCTHTLKHRWDLKILHVSGLERSITHLKRHFVRPSQRITCFEHMFLDQKTKNFMFLERNMFSLFWPNSITCYFRHCDIFFGINVNI